MATSRSDGGRAVTSRPSTRTVPASGVSSPATRRSVVDLPHPEGPMIATKSPRLRLPGKAVHRRHIGMRERFREPGHFEVGHVPSFRVCAWRAPAYRARPAPSCAHEERPGRRSEGRKLSPGRTGRLSSQRREQAGRDEGFPGGELLRQGGRRRLGRRAPCGSVRPARGEEVPVGSQAVAAGRRRDGKGGGACQDAGGHASCKGRAALRIVGHAAVARRPRRSSPAAQQESAVGNGSRNTQAAKASKRPAVSPAPVEGQRRRRASCTACWACMPKKKHAADVANSAAAKAEVHAWRFRRGAVGRQSAVAGRSCGGRARRAWLRLRYASSTRIRSPSTSGRVDAETTLCCEDNAPSGQRDEALVGRQRGHVHAARHRFPAQEPCALLYCGTRSAAARPPAPRREERTGGRRSGPPIGPPRRSSSLRR